jgi:hypothetical protein
VECDSLIPAGEAHHLAEYEFDDRHHEDHTCAACRAVFVEFGFNVYGGMLWSYMEQEWDEGARVESCMARLPTVRAKQMIRARWLLWKGLAVRKSAGSGETDAPPSEDVKP